MRNHKAFRHLLHSLWGMQRVVFHTHSQKKKQSCWRPSNFFLQFWFQHIKLPNAYNCSRHNVKHDFQSAIILTWTVVVDIENRIQQNATEADIGKLALQETNCSKISLTEKVANYLRSQR